MLWRLLVVTMSIMVGSCSAGSGTLNPEGSISSASEASSTANPAESSHPENSATDTSTPASSLGQGLDLAWDSTYRELHSSAIVYFEDPLGAQANGLPCPLIAGCEEYDLLALEGKIWRGMNDANLIVSSVQTLEELGPDVVHVKVTVNATGPVELVDDQGVVLESIDLPFDAANRVVMRKIDGRWQLENVANGRSWDAQANPPTGQMFVMTDPLNAPLVATDQTGTTADGVAWQALASGDRFCIRASYEVTGLIIRCITQPVRSGDLEETRRDDTADHDHEPFGFQMAFSSAGLVDTYLVIWFGFGVETGIVGFADGSEQSLDLFPLDTSAAFDGGELRIGISAIEQRPATVTALGTDGPLLDEPFRLDASTTPATSE